jgi:hypothetical protein
LKKRVEASIKWLCDIVEREGPGFAFRDVAVVRRIVVTFLGAMAVESSIATGEAAKILVAPTLTSLTWRVDVILSSSSVTRVMQPFIILRLGLSDGSFRTIELSVKAFHDLRFRVAEAMHSLHKLESNYLFSLRV